MHFNLLLIPTLILALVLFYLGEKYFAKQEGIKAKVLYLVASFLLGLPGLFYAFYYLHIFPEMKWYYEIRAWPYTELLACGAGLFVGSLAEVLKKVKLASRGFLISLLVIGVSIPHLKPIMAPLDYSLLQETWKDDVCLQSTQSSCGAASAATVFKSLGEDVSEEELVRECFTYRGGTENWYLARAFRKRGFQLNYRMEKGFVEDLDYPLIAGVKMDGFGHFIAILGIENVEVITADPLVGRKVIALSRIDSEYDFTGFFMEVSR